MMFKKVP